MIIKNENIASIDNTSSNVKKVLSKEDKDKLKKAAFDFQALLINQMLQSMRETKFEDEEDSGFGYGEETLSSLFDMQLSALLSKNSRFGIAEMIYEKLAGEKMSLSSTLELDYNMPLNTKKKSSIVGTDQTSKNIIPEKTTNQKIKENKNNLSNYSVNVFDVINKYDSIIEEASNTEKVDPLLIKAIIAAESNGNPKAVSMAQAKGLMQLIDATARSMGVKNVFNPADNIKGGTRYFGQLMDKYDGNIELALAAYNAGPGAVDKYNGIPPYKETQKYVGRVLNYYSLMKSRQQELASYDRLQKDN